jgi:hypothetical protein
VWCESEVRTDSSPSENVNAWVWMGLDRFPLQGAALLIWYAGLKVQPVARSHYVGVFQGRVGVLRRGLVIGFRTELSMPPLHDTGMIMVPWVCLDSAGAGSAGQGGSS